MLGLERPLQSNYYPASEITPSATYFPIRPAHSTRWPLLLCPFPSSIFLHLPIDFLFADCLKSFGSLESCAAGGGFSYFRRSVRNLEWVQGIRPQRDAEGCARPPVGGREQPKAMLASAESPAVTQRTAETRTPFASRFSRWFWGQRRPSHRGRGTSPVRRKSPPEGPWRPPQGRWGRSSRQRDHRHHRPSAGR